MNPYEAPEVSNFQYVAAEPRIGTIGGKLVLELVVDGNVVAAVDLAKVNHLMRFHGVAR